MWVAVGLIALVGCAGFGYAAVRVFLFGLREIRKVGFSLDFEEFFMLAATWAGAFVLAFLAAAFGNAALSQLVDRTFPP